MILFLVLSTLKNLFYFVSFFVDSVYYLYYYEVVEVVQIIQKEETMFILKANSKEPIFEQIKSQIIHYMSVGVLKQDDKLPSVRNMAEDLGINPNTVAKAYMQLEEAGIIYSSYKRGYFVSDLEMKPTWQEKEMNELKERIVKLKELGTTKAELHQLIEDVYKEGQ